MSSLGAHLRQSESHAKLGFHPDCPVCQEQRVFGELPSSAVVSSRTLAAITAGLLVLSAAGPPVAVAAEPDQEQSGSAPADPSPGGDSAQTPDSDPGGPATSVPDNPPGSRSPAPSQPPNPDTDAVDQEPAKETAPPIADAGDGTPEPQPARRTGATTPQTPPPGLPSSLTPPPSSTPASSAPTAAAPHATVGHRGPHPPRHGVRPHLHTAHSGSITVVANDIQVSSTQSQAPGSVPAAEVSSAPATDRRGRSTAGKRVHVVVAGECLWSIARAELGGHASDARIAREVNRLWELNKSEIATGNPDLLRVGTRLKLE